MMKNTPHTSIRKAAALAMASTLAIGAGFVVAQPAIAQDSSVAFQDGTEQRRGPGHGEARRQALVDAGIITQEQADEIRAFAEDRQAQRQADRAARHEELASTLGMTVDELESAIRSGSSLADLAAAAGVDIDTIIDQLMAPRLARLDEAVAAGRIDQAEADERAEAMRERVTARVNGEFAGPGHDGHGRGRGGRGGFGGQSGGD